MTEKNKTVDLTTGSVVKKMLLFALPIMFSGILQLLFNAADIIVLAQYSGDEAVAAVGSTGALINLMTNLFIGLAVGVNVLVSNYFGARKFDDLSKTVHTAIVLSLLSGVVLMILGYVFAPQILIMMQTTKDVLPLASIYIKTIFLGSPFMLLYNFSAAILRSVGDTKRPLYFLTIAGVINIIFNLFFVVVLKMDIFGVALATIISQGISAFLIFVCLLREKSEIKVSIKKLRIHFDKFLLILKIGIPSGIQGMMFSISNVVIQSSINSFGTTIMAGNAASSNVEGFAYTSMNSFHQAAVSFAGQNKGAGKYERINKILFTGWFYAELTAFVFALAFWGFGTQLIGLYTEGDLALASGVARLEIIGWSYFLCGLMDVTVGVIRGLGYSFMPTIVSLLGVCGVRILWLKTIFEIEKYHIVETVYYSYPISWIATFLALMICYVIIMKLNKKRRKDLLKN